MPAIIAIIIRYTVYLGAVGVGALGASLWEKMSKIRRERRRAIEDIHRQTTLKRDE